MIATLALLAATAAAGKSVAVVVVPKDSPSGQAAVVVGKHARDAFWEGYDVLDVERFLQGGEASAAEQKTKEGRAALERGRAALDALEPTPALEALAEALVAFEQGAAALTDASPLVEAQLLEGAAWAIQGDQKAARRSFERALVLDPAAELPPGSFPPNVEKAWTEVKGAAGKAGTGTLTVYATPSAAEVWVDGRFRGSAPVVLEDVAVGRHVVRVWREGYLGYGAIVEVKKSVESSVQATLRPTTRFSQYDDLAARLSGGPTAAADVAAFLKVDQLWSAVVETKGTTVTVDARLTDGVSGKELAAASKAFTLDDKMEREVKQWITATFQGATPVGASPSTTTGPPRESFLPGERKVETPGSLIWGWVLVGTSAVPAIGGVALGVYSIYLYDTFRNRVPHQLSPELDDVRAAWAVSAGASDVLGAATIAMLAGGIALVVIGSNQKAELEDVLAEVPPPPPSRAPPPPALAAADAVPTGGAR